MVGSGSARLAIHRATTFVALLAVAVWLGGLLALGAIAAPVVFAVVPLPTSADAMTLVFQRFDTVAMTCAVVVLASEAVRSFARLPFARIDQCRVGAGAVAAAVATFEGLSVTPAIAALHRGETVGGVGTAGMELARLHDIAEACGKLEVVLLAAFLVMHVLGAARAHAR